MARTRRKSAPRMRHVRDRAEVETLLLQPAPIVIVDDWVPAGTKLAQLYRMAHRGHSPDDGSIRTTVVASSLDDLADRLMRRGHRLPGRMQIAGAIVDLFLCNPRHAQGETAFDVVDWFEDDRYPLLVPLLVTAGDADLVEDLCHARGAALVHAREATPRQLIEYPSEAARAALIGTIQRHERGSIPVFSKEALFTDPELMRYLERAVFAQRDAFFIDARRFVIERVAEQVGDLAERHFCSLDALFEQVLPHRLGQARGLTKRAATQELSEIAVALRSATTAGPAETPAAVLSLLSDWERCWRRTGRYPRWGDRWRPIRDGESVPA